MAVDINELNARLGRLMASQGIEEADLDPAVLEHHLTLLQKLDSISVGAISLFDMSRREHVYMSPKFATMFGWDMEKAEAEGNAYSDSRIHPDDHLSLMESGLYYMAFALKVPVEQRKDYKVYSDFRVLGSDGGYVRVVEQQSVLELDRRGNIWLALSLLDLSPYSDLETPFRCRMINIKTGERYLFPPQAEGTLDLLTMREKEILHLISKGLVSREIADLLFISVNTVNTHRQNIIGKLEVSNTSEAVRYALDLGILSGS